MVTQSLIRCTDNKYCMKRKAGPQQEPGLGGGLDSSWHFDHFVRSRGWVVLRTGTGSRKGRAWWPALWELLEACKQRPNGVRQGKPRDLTRWLSVQGRQTVLQSCGLGSKPSPTLTLQTWGSDSKLFPGFPHPKEKAAPTASHTVCVERLNTGVGRSQVWSMCWVQAPFRCQIQW